MNIATHKWTIILIFINLFCSCAVINITNTSENPTDASIHCIGFLERHEYYCSVPGPSKRYMYVYLPYSYYSSDTEYPVTYLLHGANGNETSWIIKGDIIAIIDSLTLNNLTNECIYVFPNMNHYYNDYDYGDSREKGSVDSFLGLNGSVEYAFINDVVNYIDNNFRTIPSKKYRAIAGLSLGGLQTLYITANNHDFFEHVGLFSPLIYPPLSFGPYTSVYRNLEDKLHIQFHTQPSTYWIMVGKDDAYFNSSFFYNKLLDDNGHPHTFYISEGGHTWDNWRAYCSMFLTSLWR